MKSQILLSILLLTFLTSSKPIYDFKTSYITQLTDFNFKDQVTKIRQNTNYVSIVNFYKFSGKRNLIQMVNLKNLLVLLTNGSISTTAFLELEPSIAMNILKFVKINQWKPFLHLKSIHLHQFLRQPLQKKFQQRRFKKQQQDIFTQM